MNGQCRGKWLRMAVVLTVVVVMYAIGGGWAQAAAAPASAADVFGGFTSQRLPAFFKISADDRVLMASGIALRLKCTSGVILVVPDAFDHVPIAANGTLHTTFTSPTTIQNGVTTNGTDTLKASLGAGRSTLTGTWRLQVELSAANGQSMKCDSGPVRFTATA